MSPGRPVGSPVLWDPETLARIRSLQLIARQSVEGVLSGEHRSRRVGASVEFADYKEYQPGDDLRHLDWKVLARSDRLVTRRYQLETELSAMIVFDASGDLATGGSLTTIATTHHQFNRRCEEFQEDLRRSYR